MYGYIYLTENIHNGKIYSGQHKSGKFDTKYYGSGVIIKRLISKYGKESFRCSILEECDSEKELNEKEIYYIQKYNSTDSNIGYNIATGGAFGDSGYHMGMKGKHQTERQKEIVRKTSSYKRSNETVQKMSDSHLGNTNASGGKGMVWISNGVDEIRIFPEEISKYDGYVLGKRVPNDEDAISKMRDKYKNGTYVTKSGKDIFISNDELSMYLSDGWEIGKAPYPKSRCSNISNGKKGKVAITNGERTFFVSVEELYVYENSGYYIMSAERFKKTR